MSLKLQNVSFADGDLKFIEGNTFEIKQKNQILHIADWCNQCGNCDTFCPSSGSPYLDKPHLYMDKEIFEKERDGYFLSTEDEAPFLLCYHNKQRYKLTKWNDFSFLESDHYILKLDNNTLRITDVEVKENLNFKLDLTIAAEMSLIMRGAINFKM